MPDPVKPNQDSIYYKDGCKLYECEQKTTDAEGGVTYECNKEYNCTEDKCEFTTPEQNPNTSFYVKGDEVTLKNTILNMDGSQGKKAPDDRLLVQEGNNLSGKKYLDFLLKNFPTCRNGEVQNGPMPNPPKEASKTLTAQLIHDGKNYIPVVTVPGGKAAPGTALAITKWAEEKQNGLVGKTERVVIFHSEKGQKAAASLAKKYEEMGISAETELIGDELYANNAEEGSTEETKKILLGANLVVESFSGGKTDMDMSPKTVLNKYFETFGLQSKPPTKLDFSDEKGVVL